MHRLLHRLFPRRRARQLALWLLATALLVWVFTLYLEPGFAVAVAGRVWACF